MADRILVVDDEPDILNLTRMMLEAEGYQVATAYTGNEALARVGSEMPDLIFLDVAIDDGDEPGLLLPL